MTLAPGVAGELVQLQAMLDRALAAAGRATRVDRVIAVVLLDAVNERAIHIAAQPLQVTLSERDSFDAAGQKVAAVLGEGWPQQGWLDVRRLHRARNLAQHEALPADRDLLPAWATATSTFTRGLISTAYDVNLDDVTFADAIATAEVAERLRAAEHALADGDAGTALGAAAKAFWEATRRWKSTRRLASPIAHSRTDRLLPDLHQRVDALEDAVAVATFADDPAEYLWFTDLLRDHHTPPTVDEARRAAAFVFWWVVRWEAFTSTYVANRRAAHLTARRRVRSDATVPTITGLDSRPYGDDLDQLTVHVADVPAEHLFDAWRSCVAARLHAAGFDHAWLDEAGSVVLNVRRDVPAELLVESVRAALEHAETDAGKRRAADDAAHAERAAAAEAYRSAAAECQLPPWTSVIDLDPSAHGGSGAVLNVDRNFNMSRVCEVLRAQPQVNQAYAGAKGVVIVPAPDGPTLAALMWAVDLVIRPEIEQREREASAARAAADQRARELRVAMGLPEL